MISPVQRESYPDIKLIHKMLTDILLPISGVARSKTRSSRKTRKPRRISFPRFSTPSFPFCTLPKTENSEMKTSECSFKPFYQTPSFSNSEFSLRFTRTAIFFNYLIIKLRSFPTPSFPFCTTLKTENSEMENLGV